MLIGKCLKRFARSRVRIKKQTGVQVRKCPGIVGILLLVATSIAGAEEQKFSNTDEELAEVMVHARRVANTRPAGSYASVATALRFDPQTELQSRGLAEGQSDVTVRGGIFENTGFVVGATTIFDPQTGHYTAGLPIDPAYLSSPQVQTGVDNALNGFNSNVASVSYGLPIMNDGGEVVFGLGDHDLWYSSLRLANAEILQSGNDLVAAVSVAWSQGDGTLPDGDHEFSRFNLLLQHRSENVRTDVLLAYQDKFYAWPGAYTGFASLAETDHTKTTLFLLNQKREFADGWLKLSGYYRNLEDDYDFNRNTTESGVPGSFDHTTRVTAIGFQGSQRNAAIDWRYGGQVTLDRLVRSTDLTEGNFTSRNYLKLSLVPSVDIASSGNRVINARVGVSVDTSNRDSTSVSPVAGLGMEKTLSSGHIFYALEYASASQLPGYTVLSSRPTGLFGGNAGLGREKTRQLSLSVRREAIDWTAALTLFYREEDDLVDWTFDTAVPFSRQANAVDLDVVGVEVVANRQWRSVELVAAFTYLDKSSNYGSASVDASFYALNYARYRATLALVWQLNSQLELRLDNEYRRQLDNPLRTSTDTAFLSSLAISWQAADISGFGVTLTVDNLSDSEFQFFPGTPAVGRQLSASARYRW